MTEFQTKVIKVVKSIPPGSVLTYKQVATQAGNPKASRAVGSLMAKNFDPTIPCHRVIRSDGTLGEYNRGKSRKAELLRKEGYSH